MNHKPYVDWLFEEAGEQLPEQSKALEEHLAECESCRGLADSFRQMQNSLREAPMLSPREGFASRWQEFYLVQRERAYRRQLIRMFVFVFGGLFVLMLASALWAYPWLRNPSLLLWTWVYQWFSMFSYANVLQELGVSLLQGVSGIIPLAALVIGLGLLSELAVLWVVSFRLLTNPRSVLK